MGSGKKSINYKDPNSFFPKIKRIYRPKKQLEIDTLHVKKNDHQLLKNVNKIALEEENDHYLIEKPIDKITVMGNFYQKINTPRHTNHDTPIRRIVLQKIAKYKEELALRKFSNNTITNFNNNNPANDLITTDEEVKNYFTNYNQLRKIISRLPNKCSAGLDGIPHIIIKHLPELYVNYLTIILNNMLNNKNFPKAWKCAKVLPVLKPGKDPHEPTSHRPISLTCNFSKLLEIIIDIAIERHCKKNKIIPESQFGFQQKLSTSHAINAALNIINKHLNENEVVGACLIDIEKAFDSTWIDGLIFILIQLQFPLFLIDMIYDMVTNKTFKIWDGKLITEIIFLILEGLQ